MRSGRAASRRGSSRTRGPIRAACCAKDAEAFGLAERLDVLVFSEEVGLRKPDPEIFLHACRQLEVETAATMYVGDNLVTDVQGAADVGMTTVQALWFRADDTPGIEADFMAFTPMDVLNAVLRLAR